MPCAVDPMAMRTARRSSMTFPSLGAAEASPAGIHTLRVAALAITLGGR